ncbi:MAG: redoxin domain-containing protein, partial [Weeksellaceae bacterium]|nr:redoxin domain-containing protein [Weeksellaceae bacterium]
MRKIIYVLTLVISMGFLTAQEADFPDAPIRDLKGNQVNIKAESMEGKTIVLAFWATWCGPCMLELNAINDKIDDWASETDFQLYAISLDDSKTVGRVQPMV